MDRKEFYTRCAELLGAAHDYHPEPTIGFPLRYDGTIRNVYKTRWNGRNPGNGRFPGHGFIRHFGGFIHVNLHTPPLCGVYEDEEGVLSELERVMNPVHTSRPSVHIRTDAELDALRVLHKAEAPALPERA